MAIWSLTQERVDKLLRQIGDKEEEIDQLIKLTPKDIWLRDLEEFETEWHTQLLEEEERTKKADKKGRRGSRKLGIGAAKGGGKRKKKRSGDSDSDDSESDYGPARKKTKPKAAAGGMLSYLKKEEPSKPSATAALKSGAATAKKQAGMLGYLNKKDTPSNLDGADDVEMSDATPAPPEPAPAPAAKKGRPAAAKAAKAIKPPPEDSESDEDVFAAVAQEAEKKKPAQTVTTSRTARGAAKKATNYAVDKDSDSDDMDDDFDVSNMVQTIGGSSNDRPLFTTTARPGSATGATKSSSRTVPLKLSPIDLDPDETNYEGLMPQGSPNKPAPRNVHDTILSSDDDDLMLSLKKKAPAKPAAKPAAKAAPKAKAAAAKPVPKPKASASSAAAKKTSDLSPAAKAYAARLGKGKEVAAKPAPKAASKKPIMIDSDEEDELDNTEVLANEILSDEEEDEPTPKPKPAAARPGRRAAAKPAKYVLSDDDDDDDISEASFDDDSD